MIKETKTLGLLLAVLLTPPMAAAQDKTKAQQQDAVTGEDFDFLQGRVDELADQISGLRPGQRSFLLTGYGFGGFGKAEGNNSSFNAGFNPIFLWTPSERVFFEGELELELEDNETVAALEYAQLSYVLGDSVILGVGKFLNPANVFQNRLHPAWINKLPDKPLVFGSHKMVASSQLGAQVHGGVPVGGTKMNYAVYVSNGPSMEAEDPMSYGSLGFKDFEDSNNSKAVGARLGVFVLPELELGYSIEQASNVTPDGVGTAKADALIQSVDLNYTGSAPGGVIDCRAQWVMSNVDDVVFDPAGTTGFGPVMLDNERDGGYVQLAYRPSKSDNATLSKMEGVVRYDAVNLPTGAPEGVDESRVTFGVNYWTSASSVFKTAYQIDSPDGASDTYAVFFQWALGL